VFGLHYTAMPACIWVSPSEGSHHHIEGLAGVLAKCLSLVVALLLACDRGRFLLSLVPDPGRKTAPPRSGRPAFDGRPTSRPIVIGRCEQPRQSAAAADAARRHCASRPAPHPAPRPCGEGADGTHFIDSAMSGAAGRRHYTKSP